MTAEILDHDTLAELRMLQTPKRPTFLADVVGTFVDNSSTQLESLKGAVQSGNDEEIRSIAHSIKGSSRSVGAVVVTELAARLETESADAATAGATTEQLANALAEAHKALLEAAAR